MKEPKEIQYTTTEIVKEDGFKIISRHPVFTPEEQKRNSIELTRQLYNIFNKHKD